MARTAIHPGEVLGEELEARETTAAALAEAIGMPESWVKEFLEGKRDLTEETAGKLAEYFGTSEELWVNLQRGYIMDLQGSSPPVF